MRRRQWRVVAAAIGPALVTAVARADGTQWPEALPAEWGQRGPGGGLAVVPLVLWWLAVLGWAATVDRVNRDARKHKFRPALWSTVVALPFVGAALLAWWIPSALAGFVLMLLSWLGPLVAYAVLRNRQVAESERILTPGHARRVVAGLLAPLGIDLGLPGDAAEVLPDVRLAAAGGRDDAENAARLQRAGATPGCDEAIKLLQEAVVARAATVLIEPDPQGIMIRHEVDGVWEKPRVRKPPRSRKEKETFPEAPRPTREAALAVIDTLATLCGLPQARGGRSGTFALQVDGKPRNCRLAFRAASGGEQVVVQIEPPAAVFKKPADVGMPAGIADRLGELLALEKGLIVISSPPASGLTTTFDVVVQTADRLLRDFISLEDAAVPPREIQNVRPVRFDARTGVTALDALTAALREYPRVIVTRDLRDRSLAVELVRLAGDEQFVIVSMKAADAVDAVARLEAYGVAPDQLARTLVGSVAQRLVRKLCPKCREEYPTPGELLARLKTTAEKLPHLRKASAQGCRLCRGTGYLGRTAVFELATGGSLRQAIAAKADQKLLRQAAVKDGMQSMRDAGMALVVEGVTSLEEMQRVFSAAAARPEAAEARAK
jgi:type II secretory ATPase GspE/PulE/Tfp pilus assembly ATPase PilB-like protein